MNVRLLLKVRQAVLDEPRRYYQLNWVTISDDLTEAGIKPSDRPPCGTAACLAGHAYFIGRKLKSFKLLVNHQWEIQGEATRLLDLTYDEAFRLFSAPGRTPENCGCDACQSSYGSTGWPPKFAQAYLKAKTAKGRARAAARRIDHFIKTEGME